MKLSVVGLGPGAGSDLTGRARRALEESELIVGYTAYVEMVKGEFPGKEFMDTGMRREEERCRAALERAARGVRVAVVCSGDAGVYGMAGLIYEVGRDYPSVDIEVIPGVTAALGGAAVLGAPMTHDFAVVSLSDLLISWHDIERRLRKAAQAGFVICLYNPASRSRPDHLKKACDILLKVLDGSTVCAWVRNVGREGEESRTLKLSELREEPVDMFTTVFIGNGQTQLIGEKMITPRGYEMKRD